MIIKIPKSKFKGPFNLKLCMESEQCPTDVWQGKGEKFKTFIWTVNKWTPVEIWETSKTLFVKSPKDVSKEMLYHFWAEYDVLDFYSRFASDKYLSKTIKSLQGLRVMRNLDFNWGVCEAICTQNSAIRQIRNMEKNLRKFYGDGHTINLKKLAEAREGEIKERCKVGYRAKYLINLAKLLQKSNIEYASLKEIETPEARKVLLKIKGVGPKVADIILLYTIGKPDAFPMDIWLKRALIREYFNNRKKVSLQKLRDFALNHFGEHAGIAHLYMFCYERKVTDAKN